MTSRGLNSDPLRNFRYRVAINHPSDPLKNLARMGFMAVSGLSVNNEVIPYREGGNNTTTRKMPGQSDFGPLTMTRGFMAATHREWWPPANIGTNEIYTWFTQIFSVAIGQGFGSAVTDFRVGVTIDILEHPITAGGMAAGRDMPPPIKARFARVQRLADGLQLQRPGGRRERGVHREPDPGS